MIVYAVMGSLEYIDDELYAIYKSKKDAVECANRLNEHEKVIMYLVREVKVR